MHIISKITAASYINCIKCRLYIYIASYITKLFFPHQNGLLGLIETFGVFAAGYLMRPIGGIIFGQLGDRLGRKKTLIYAVSCMGLSVLITASLPTYKQLGPAASALLLLARMLQGFSVGGEHTGVLVMLIEQANQKYRGF